MNSLKNISLSFFLSGSLLICPNYAQQKRILTLDESIQIALDKSFSRRSLGLSLEGARYGLKAAKGQFKTNAQLRLLLPDFTEFVSEDTDPNGLTIFNTRGSTQYQSTLDINQPLPTDGRFTLSSVFSETNSVKSGSNSRNCAFVLNWPLAAFNP